MSFKRLKGATGNLLATAPIQSDTANSIKRKAILIHSGPEGANLELESSDGPIAFDKARIERVVKNQNELIEKMVGEYGGWDKTPIGAFPPILDQHSDDSNDRIRGRLSSPLRFEVLDVPKVGKNVACAVTEICFIGKDTVEKVNDGRIYHLSVGISETTDTLGETSIVIEPAAPGAMLLNKGKNMGKKTAKITAKPAQGKKNLAASKRKDLLKKLSAQMGEMTKMIKSASENMNLAKRENEVKGTFKRLMASKKMTPAEMKKMDIKRLSALDPEAFKTIVDSFEARQDVILVGQRGSKDARGVGDMSKDLEKSQYKRLKKEIRGDFKKLGKKMSDDQDEDDKSLAFGEDKDEKEMAGAEEKDEKDLSGADNSDLAQHEEQDVDSIKKLQTQIDELNTNLARMAGMVTNLMEHEQEEGEAELAEGEESDEKELESKDEEGDKELAKEGENDDKEKAE